MSKVKKAFFLKFSGIFFLSTLLLSGLIWTGLSRRFEWIVYDQYLKFCPRKAVTNDIIIIGYTESDIKKFDGVPIHDQVFVDVLLKIIESNPQIIGFDLHRNVPTGNSPSASLKLAEIFRNTPNFVGLEKSDGGNPLFEPIDPHPALIGKTGASDIIEDHDGIVRRSYLNIDKSSGETISSFALALALKYLDKENLKIPEPLRNNRFFYHPDSFDNEQILINYCFSQQSFDYFSLSQVLSKDFSGEIFRNKIILIGSMAETGGDIFTIPNESKVFHNSDFTYGVKLHSYIATFFINSAGSPHQHIKFLPIILEYFLLSFFFLCSSLLFTIFLQKDPKTYSFLTLLLFGQLACIFLLGFILFLNGWWIPAATSSSIILILSLLASIFVYHHKINAQNKLLSEKLKEQEEKLSEFHKSMAEKDKRLAYQGLANILSHEIKNQTNSVKLNANNCSQNISEIYTLCEENSVFIEEASDTPEFLRVSEDPGKLLFSKSLEQLSRIAELVEVIDTILKEFDLNSGRTIVQVYPFDLNELLQTIVSESTQKAPLINLKIESNYDSSLSSFLGIKEHIQRAFENIILNACDSLISKKRESDNEEYLPTLTIITKKEVDHIQVIIKDNGKGILKENLDKIFKLHWTTKEMTGGKGLGLFFANSLIEQHGGEIEVESEPDQYAQFTVKLSKS